MKKTLSGQCPEPIPTGNFIFFSASGIVLFFGAMLIGFRANIGSWVAPMEIGPIRIENLIFRPLPNQYVVKIYGMQYGDWTNLFPDAVGDGTQSCMGAPFVGPSLGSLCFGLW